MLRNFRLEVRFEFRHVLSADFSVCSAFTFDRHCDLLQLCVPIVLNVFGSNSLSLDIHFLSPRCFSFYSL